MVNIRGEGIPLLLGLIKKKKGKLGLLLLGYSILKSTWVSSPFATVVVWVYVTPL
jgi:hypothetical protein